MADSFTNRGLVLQVTGSNVGTWGTDLNVNDITITDSILGSTQALTLGSGTTAITQSQSQNFGFHLTGTLTGAVTITLPFNLATSATTAVGGAFLFDNQTTGSFSVTVKTVAAGSTGVTVPQGLRASLYSDGTNVYYANDGGKSTAYKVGSYAGDPNGVVVCTPASATTPADMLWDYTDNILWVCTGAPSTWTQAVPTPTASSVPSATDGYLTLSSNSNSCILSSDVAGATTVYYNAFVGNLLSIPNGATYTTYTIGQLALALNSSYQAANTIYDVFGFVNSGSATLGFGPAWQSSTAGSSSRGTGGGTTQIGRLAGLWSNMNSMTVNNGATTYTVAPLCGTYLGSIYVDSTAGQVSCYVTYGQSRKWGVWNAYNRLPISLIAGDNTGSWSYNSTLARVSNGSSANSLTVFCGLSEEIVETGFGQSVDLLNEGAAVQGGIFVGWNSTSSSSGRRGTISIGEDDVGESLTAYYIAPPFLGINNVYSLEVGGGAGTMTFFGTQTNMLLYANWRG